MKHLTTILLTILIASATVYGQDTKEKQLSNADQFSAKAGTLIEKQFIDIGQVKGVQVKVLKLKDLNDGTTKTALRLEYEYKSSYSTDTKIASLDSDEIEGLIKSIKNLQTNVFTSTRDTYTEVTFKSRTGFEAGAYYDTGKSKWTAYMQLSKYDSKSSVFLNTDDFSTFLTLIEQAKTKM
jgi:hypothetical protein